jgi:hypothetical protein
MTKLLDFRSPLKKLYLHAYMRVLLLRDKRNILFNYDWVLIAALASL